MLEFLVLYLDIARSTGSLCEAIHRDGKEIEVSAHTVSSQSYATRTDLPKTWTDWMGELMMILLRWGLYELFALSVVIENWFYV